MGSLLGFYLSGVGEHEVWLLSQWQQHVAAMQAHGLECERNGCVEQRRVRATIQLWDVGACDIVLVLLKAYQTPGAGERIRALLHERTLVITLQNGIGNRDILAHTLSAARVVQGVTMLGATMIGPGRVRHAGYGPTLFAQTDEDHDAMAALVKLFQAAGLPAEMRDDVETIIWSKLIINVGINALTALLRVPNGALVTAPSARSLVGKLVSEAAAVAQARGTSLPDDVLDRVFAVATATGANHSSMLQDALRGNQTEIDTINGAIVREGERLGVPTPYNRIITDLMHAHDEISSRVETA